MGYDVKAVADSFRQDLPGVWLVLEKLQPLCEKTADLQEMIEVALKNDGQLNLLMTLIQTKK